MTETASSETNQYVAGLPMILARVTAVGVERISPAVVRVELGGAALADFGTSGPVYDQRIKLVFPNARGELVSLAGMDESWWDTWIAIPEDERGSMRTYTIRDVVGDGANTRLVVDVVVHEPAAGEQPSGAGNAWALGAEPGDEVIVLCPRAGHEFGGVEWAPGDATRLLIVGDETAAPAIRGILRDLPADARGAVFLETVDEPDVYDDLAAPAGVTVTWLPRAGSARGEALHAAVLAHLTGAGAAAPEVTDDDVDPDLWETPAYSSSGEEVAGTARTGGTAFPGLYAWIAGESKVVTGLRRALVNDLGVDRAQVAFMGYWREGVAMRS